MAEKKLFEDLQLDTPTDDDRLAFGKPSSIYKNITIADFKTLIAEGTGILNTSIYDIGTWNMNSQSERWVITDIPFADLMKIRKVSVMIVSDEHFGGFRILSDFGVYDGTFDIGPDTETLSGNVGILMTRATGGHYDSTTFEDTGDNRGWVIIEYLP